jgi:hypothetical protein
MLLSYSSLTRPSISIARLPTMAMASRYQRTICALYFDRGTKHGDPTEAASDWPASCMSEPP